ncbi:unnamed protein product [Fraxinus pennsylvanica]|uniref:RNase H type-1 domain-containing protein n=1 Tax=Fraxinus pennsylvanica TaxID=56036 RepID=A0AAD2DL67_9LAMI|nr:unnamed protein product [Fraxinus pennsylvanica]
MRAKKKNLTDVMLKEAGLFIYGDRPGDLDVGSLDSLFLAYKQHREHKVLIREKLCNRVVKLNMDGCSKGTDECSGGGILRDHERKEIFEFNEYYSCGCIVVAELKALLGGLKICFERGYQKIWVELDLKVVIDLVSDPGIGTWEFQEVRRISSRMDVCYSHIYQEGNHAAGCMAYEGYYFKSKMSFEHNELPNIVKSVVRKERYGVLTFG